MIMMTLYVVVQDFLLRIYNSHPIFVYPCHPQMPPTALVVIFLETPDWLWHCDLAIDSMFLIGQAQVRIYIFFCRPFSILFSANSLTLSPFLMLFHYTWHTLCLLHYYLLLCLPWSWIPPSRALLLQFSYCQGLSCHLEATMWFLSYHRRRLELQPL